MKKTLLFLFVLAGFGVQAQTHLLGINLGTNSSSISSNAVFGSPTLRLGFLGGLTYEYILKNKLSFGTDILFNQRGFRQSTIFTDRFGQPLGTSNSEYRFDYLSIPVKIWYYYGNRIFGFGNIGIVSSFLLSAEYIYPTLNISGEIVEQPPVESTSSYSSFNLGGRVEIGGGYKINERFWLTASAAYLHSLTPTKVTGFLNDLQLNQFDFNFNLGMKYTL